MIRAKVLGRKHSEGLSKPDLKVTFSDVCLVKMELRPNDLQCSSDMSEPKYTRNARQPNTRIRVCTYARARMHIRTYAYTVYTRMPH